MKRHLAAFTLAELTVSLGASVIVLGGLLLSSITLQKTLFEKERFNNIRDDQRRIIDYVSRELRRAVSVATKDSSGLPIATDGQTVTLEAGASVIFTLPGYYKSNTPDTAEFDQPLGVITSENEIAYGDSNGAAPPVLVWIMKSYVVEEGCICFVRKEANRSQVIVRDASNLNVRLRFSPDGRTCNIESWVRTPIRDHTTTLWSYDTVLMRNVEDDSS